MANICEVCGKKKDTGFQISHSHRKSKKVWNANIQKIRVAVPGGNKKRIRICTRCIKSGRVKKAVI